jgi:amino acid permease
MAIMKIFVHILSVYILALIIMPCNEVPHDRDLHQNGLSQNSTDSHQNNTKHCSPFCTCFCCASPIVYQTFSILAQSFPLIQKQYPEYKSGFVSSLHYTIWQPPEII